MTLTPGRVNQGLPAAAANAWPVSLPAPPTITEKQDQPASTNATWTSATGANTTVTVNTTGYGTATISIQVPSTVTAGVISIEVSDDAGTTYYPAGSVRVDNGLAENVVSLQLTAGTANSRMYAASVDAMTQVRARLSTVITGTGNVLVRVGVIAGGIEPLVSTIPPRTMFAATGSLNATPTTETFVSLTPVRGVTAGGASTTMTVTTNKTLRITSITLAIQNITTAAVDPTLILLRAKASGTIATTDPAIWRTRISNAAAVLNTLGGPFEATFPDGIDLPSGAAFGLSSAAASTNGILEVSVNGYEF